MTAGGTVTGNNQVWRKLTFGAITTTKIRVDVSGAPDGVARVAELEAYEVSSGGAAGEGEVNWLVADQLGTPRMILEQSGSLSAEKRHDYLPFGEELQAATGGRITAQGYSSDNVRQKFTGKERDSDTGLDYMQARYYGSSMGRFTSIDPYDINLERQSISDAREANAVFKQYLGNPQHWNRYAYVLNNPLKYVDPDGLAEKLTVNLNIVYDRNQFTEEEAKKALAAQVADLKKVYGPLDIDFNITYTAGTANSNRTEITQGARDGAVNVFFSQDKSTFHNEGYNSSNGQIFLTIGADQASHPIGEGALSHELGHKFGVIWNTGLVIDGVDLGNIYSDFHIDTSNAKLRRGGAKEGDNWVDDYRNVTSTHLYVTQGGEVHREILPRKPTTFDIYRVGARKLAGK